MVASPQGQHQLIFARRAPSTLHFKSLGLACVISLYFDLWCERSMWPYIIGEPTESGEVDMKMEKEEEEKEKTNNLKNLTLVV